MRCEIRVVSGARAGHHEVFDKSYVGIGRHPLSDVRFDAEQDLDSSTRHAAIVKTGDTYVLRDLGSTNGTFVNGERIESDRQLHDGDTLRFGFHGPEATFHLVREQEEVVIEAVHLPPKADPAAAGPRATHDGSAAPPSAPPATPPAPPSPPSPPRAAKSAAGPKAAPAPPAPAPHVPAAAAAQKPPSATGILRAELSVQRGRFRAIMVSLVILFVGAAAVVIIMGRTANQVQTQLVQRVDSLTRQVAQLRHLQAAADTEAARLRTQLAAERDPALAQVLQQRLTTVERRSQSLVQAQGLDYTAIRNANDPAVAMIYVRFADTTQMWTGTAFSVSAGGLMVTNRHLVLNERGERPRDIAVQFSGSREVLPARLERVASDVDLATIQLESQGPFPAVRGLAGDTIVAGSPIALIGFPGGAGSGIPRATLVTGSVTRVVMDSLLEVDAFSGTGASGSPIFDFRGRVVGVLFGGRGGSSSREVVGLPIRRAAALLPQ